MVKMIIQAAADKAQDAGIDLNGIRQGLSDLLTVIAGMVKNPWMSAILLAMVGVITGGIIFFLKKSADDLAKKKAKEDTDRGYQDQIDNRIPKNEQNNDKDNENRKKIDDIQL